MHSLHPSQHPAPAGEQSKAALSDPAAAGTRPGIRRIDSTELFNGAPEVEIEHQGQVYRLRRTSLGKLILTK